MNIHTKVRKHYIIPDVLWDKIEPLILHKKDTHPLGCHRPRVPNRDAMNGIFFVLRTGCQWNALNETGICTSSTAHKRFQEWTEAGVFKAVVMTLLKEYDELKGIDWSFCSGDGAITKAPLAGEKSRKKSSR